MKLFTDGFFIYINEIEVPKNAKLRQPKTEVDHARIYRTNSPR